MREGGRNVERIPSGAGERKDKKRCGGRAGGKKKEKNPQFFGKFGTYSSTLYTAEMTRLGSNCTASFKDTVPVAAL